MKIILTYFFLFYFINLTFSQTEFNRVYDDVEQIFVNKIYSIDDNYAVVGSYQDTTNIYYKIFVKTIDSLGNVVEQKNYVNDTMNLYVYNSIQLENGGFVLCGQGVNSNYMCNFLMKFDENFDSLYIKYIYTLPDDSLISRTLNIETDYDGGFLLIGHTNFINNDSNIFENLHIQLIKTDSEGNFIFRKVYYDDTKYTVQDAYYIKKLFGNGYVIGSWSVYNMTGDWQLVKLNNSYEVDEFKYYGSPSLRDGRMEGMISTSDSCILISGKYPLYMESYDWYGLSRVLKLDRNLNTVFSYLYGDTTHYVGFRNPIELCSGNYLFVENREDYQSYYHKISSTGEYLMTKHIQSYDSLVPDFNDYHNIVYNTIITENNSALSVGQVFGYNYVTEEFLNTLWAVKTNNIGDNSLCNSIYVPRINNEGVIIFPNPATNNLQIQFKVFTNGIIVIYDIYGRPVLQEQILDNNININVSKLDNGIYFVKINNQIFKLLKK